MRKKNRSLQSAIIILCTAMLGAAAWGGYFYIKERVLETPEELLVRYMDHIEGQEYDSMYSMVALESSNVESKEKFIERNSKIYEGMEADNFQVSNVIAEKQTGKKQRVIYRITFDTIAGKVDFTNEAEFIDTGDGYRLIWKDSLILPDLTAQDRVQVSDLQAERGEILDRKGKVLAGKGTASSLGIIPGKLEDRENAIKRLSELSGADTETIENSLAAGWVKEDSFVPIATLPKIQELDLMSPQAEDSILREYERQEQILKIPGTMLTDMEIRSYSLGRAAAHLVGYVQAVTAEDLEEHSGEGYSSDSVIGRTGIEGLYEKELKGKNGCEIDIVDSHGNLKKCVARTEKEDGKDIRLTIDSDLQESLYEQFKDDRGCSVAVHPYTGEVLALVSTPSYDTNELVKGVSSEQWNAWNEDEARPLYNRFRQIWCPGSTFKPVVAGIGLKTGMLDPNEDFGNEGLAWQKDPSWGTYQVTTLHAYGPVVLKNAILYSDNIYFAKAALKIGADQLMGSLDQIGFNQELPFEIKMEKSQYSNTDKIETEIQLADSGYGQGEILVNPLHLASIYTAFLNDGNMIKPYLQYRENAAGEVWINGAFTAENVREVMEGAKAVINDPNGTGHAAYREDVLLAGKTGTAELKASQEDTSGTEIGWFSVFTAEKDAASPVLLISMVENVKNLGGCGYVIGKDRAALEEYFAPGP